MENKQKQSPLNRYAGMSANDIVEQALSGDSHIPGNKSTSLGPKTNTTPEAIKEQKVPTQVEIKERSSLTGLSVAPIIPIQPIPARDTSNLIKVNTLFAKREKRNATCHINGVGVSINLNGDYDTLIKAIGMATALVLDSGDNYVFAPNQRVISDLIFLRAVTELDLEFLTLPEIRFSQLIETYDIVFPIIQFIDTIEDSDFQDYRRWYNSELRKSIEAALQYQNSAKGIVDALAVHNIKDQQTMAEQMGELDSDKLSMVVDFMKNMEPKK